MKQSMRSDRWQPLQLTQPKDYSSQAVQERWQQQRNQWLNVRCWISSRFRNEMMSLTQGRPIHPQQYPPILTIRLASKLEKLWKAFKGPIKAFQTTIHWNSASTSTLKSGRTPILLTLDWLRQTIRQRDYWVVNLPERCCRWMIR